MEILWDSCYTGSLALSGIFPEQELGADALFERGIVQVIAETEIEHRHAAGDEADDVVVTLAALLLAEDDLADGKRIVKLLFQAVVYQVVNGATDNASVVFLLIAGGDGVLDLGVVQADVVVYDLHLGPHTAVLGVLTALFLIEVNGAGGKDGAALLDPLALDVQERGAGSGDGNDVSLTDRSLEIGLNDRLYAVLLADVRGKLLGGSGRMVVADDLLDVGQLGDDRVKAGGAYGAAADAQQDLCVLASQIAGRDAGDSARAGGAYEVCAHVGDGFAGFLVVERYHQDRPRQADFLVCGV